MNEHKLKKPWVYKNHVNVYEDAIFSDLDTSDCNDSVNGKCFKNLSLTECIEKMIQKSFELPSTAKLPSSSAGYHIENGNETICVPIRSEIHPHLNNEHRLRNKSIYPVMKDMKTHAFINTNKVFDDRSVLIQDFFLLKNVETGLMLFNPEFSDSILLNESKSSNLQLVSNHNTLYRNSRYISARYGFPYVLNIPGTSLVVSAGEYNHATLKPHLLPLHNTKDLFYFYPKDGNGKSDTMNFLDTFYILYQNIFLVEVIDGVLTFVYDSYDNVLDESRNVHFTLIPNVEVYYCDSGTASCLQSNMHDVLNTKIKLYRNPSCLGECGETNKNRGVCVLFLFILCLVLYLIMRFSERVKTLP